MADVGTRFTDRQQVELEKRLRRVYSDAAKDIEAKMQDFNRRHKVKEAKYRQMVKDGKITQGDFNSWMRGQVFQGKQWQAKKDQITETLYQSNQIAAKMVHGETVGVFTHNANFMSYQLEHTAGVNFGFGIYDSATVARLIRGQPDLLPNPRVKRSKDKQWNSRKLTEQITQGIIQGEPLDKIAKRMAQAVSVQDWKFMRTYARTAMTGAQNAGRQISLWNARNMGIKVKKEWMATLDEHTRTEHAELDGQKVDTDKPFKVGGYTIMYPGDPAAHPAMVYNCRCTLVGDLEDYPSEYERYDNIEGKPIKNMTYQEWYDAKKGIEAETVVDTFQSMLGRAKTVQEVNDAINSQNWFGRRKRIGSHYDDVSGRYVDDWDYVPATADLTGCDLDAAKAVGASYEQVFTKYPKLIGKIDAPDAHPVGMKPNTYAWCYARSGGKVQVNPDMYKDWPSLTRQYERDVTSRWHPQGTTAESIVTHEIGHAVDGLLAQERILGGYTKSGEFRYASSSLKSTIVRRLGMDNTSTAVVYSVSRYGSKNPQEWFAEAFAEYITSANPREVASALGAELEKLIGRLP